MERHWDAVSEERLSTVRGALCPAQDVLIAEGLACSFSGLADAEPVVQRANGSELLYAVRQPDLLCSLRLCRAGVAAKTRCSGSMRRIFSEFRLRNGASACNAEICPSPCMLWVRLERLNS